MNSFYIGQRALWLYFLLTFFSSCHTTHYNLAQPEKNGQVIMSIERTPCFGSCPVYKATLYENGLLLYQGTRFTHFIGCYYCSVSKSEMKKVQQWFLDNGFFSFDNKYPKEDIAPTDLPGCTITFNNKGQQKTILDRGWKTPRTLTALENKVDTWINIQNLQACDK